MNEELDNEYEGLGQDAVRWVIRLIALGIGVFILGLIVGYPTVFTSTANGRIYLFPDYMQLIKFIGGLIVVITIANVLSGTIYVLPEWNRAVILRLGKFQRTAGSGLIVIPPFIYSVVEVLDRRMQTYAMTTQQTLTKDNVPVDVEGVLYFQISGDSPERAITEVEDYADAVFEAAEATLRDAIGQHTLQELLGSRDSMGKAIQEGLGDQVSKWAIVVDRVLIKDIRIPADLQQSMSRVAQAEQEMLSRVKLSEGELMAADNMVAAAEKYEGKPNALMLRKLNVGFESITSSPGSKLFVLPSMALDSFANSALPLAMQQMDENSKSE